MFEDKPCDMSLGSEPFLYHCGLMKGMEKKRPQSFPLRCSSLYREGGNVVRLWMRWRDSFPCLSVRGSRLFHLVSLAARWYAHLAGFPSGGAGPRSLGYNVDKIKVTLIRRR